MTERQHRVRVLFVCLGNICRSPSAHGVFRARVVSAGLADRIAIDSAGTGDWHIGDPPDARATAAAALRNIAIDDLRARRVTAADLARFDYVLAMDEMNLDELKRLAYEAGGEATARIALFSEYSARYPGRPVPDPYFGGKNGFDDVLDMIEDASAGLLAAICTRLNQSTGR